MMIDTEPTAAHPTFSPAFVDDASTHPPELRVVSKDADRPLASVATETAARRPDPDWVAILRDPTAIAERCIDERNLHRLVSTALVSIVVGASLFGAAVGSFRGGVQIAFAAIKLPIVLIATLVVFAPALFGLSRSLGRAWSFGTVVALATSSIARAALVLGALAPPLWLALDAGIVGYHLGTLLAVAMMGAAGVMSLAIGTAVLSPTPRDGALALLAGAVFFAALGQSSWVLRPYLVRPRETETVFVRPPEGTFIEATLRSIPSALGLYADSTGELRDDDVRRNDGFGEHAMFESGGGGSVVYGRPIDELPTMPEGRALVTNQGGAEVGPPASAESVVDTSEVP